MNEPNKQELNDSGVKLQIVASLTDDSRGVIYNCNMFIVQATAQGAYSQHFIFFVTYEWAQ